MDPPGIEPESLRMSGWSLTEYALINRHPFLIDNSIWGTINTLAHLTLNVLPLHHRPFGGLCWKRGVGI